jgi:hypothetical protein
MSIRQAMRFESGVLTLEANGEFAYVLHQPLRDLGKYEEGGAVHQGMKVKVFETPDEATEWLELSPGN